MQDIGQLLNKKFKVSVNYFGAVEILSSNWQTIVGDMSLYLTPNNIYKNELILLCDNPSWMSEVDYFKDNILEKCNALLKQKKNRVRLIGVKVKLGASELQTTVVHKSKVPKGLEACVKWNVEEKKKSGAKLCVKCKKVWDQTVICGICRLTS